MYPKKEHTTEDQHRQSDPYPDKRSQIERGIGLRSINWHFRQWWIESFEQIEQPLEELFQPAWFIAIKRWFVKNFFLPLKGVRRQLDRSELPGGHAHVADNR